MQLSAIIGSNSRTVLKKSGHTQDVLAEMLGLKRRQFSNWLAGEKMPKHAPLLLAQALSDLLQDNISVADLSTPDFGVRYSITEKVDILKLQVKYPSLREFLTKFEYLDIYKPTKKEVLILTDVHVNFQPTIRFWIGVLNEIRLADYSGAISLEDDAGQAESPPREARPAGKKKTTDKVSRRDN